MPQPSYPHKIESKPDKWSEITYQFQRMVNSSLGKSYADSEIFSGTSSNNPGLLYKKTKAKTLAADKSPVMSNAQPKKV